MCLITSPLNLAGFGKVIDLLVSPYPGFRAKQQIINHELIFIKFKRNLK